MTARAARPAAWVDDGLAPISGLDDDYFVHDEAGHSLVGDRTGVRWRLGSKVEVRLREANPVTGGLILEVVSDPEPPDKDWRASPRGGRRSNVQQSSRGRR